MTCKPLARAAPMIALTALLLSFACSVHVGNRPIGDYERISVRSCNRNKSSLNTLQEQVMEKCPPPREVVLMTMGDYDGCNGMERYAIVNCRDIKTRQGDR